MVEMLIKTLQMEIIKAELEEADDYRDGKIDGLIIAIRIIRHSGTENNGIIKTPLFFC